MVYNFFMVKNRFLSFFFIFLVYAIAVFGGIFCYDFLGHKTGLSARLLLLLADIFATILVFIFSLIFRNASVYDPYWSVQPPVILALTIIKCGIKYRSGANTGYEGLSGENGLLLPGESDGLSLFIWLIFAAVLFWGIRLTANWAYTFTNLEHQDWRYSMLKEKSKKAYPLVNFFGIHLFPTLVVYLCILPAFSTIINAFSGGNLTEFSSTARAEAALAGQITASQTISASASDGGLSVISPAELAPQNGLSGSQIFNVLCGLFILLAFAAPILQGIADIQMHRFRNKQKAEKSCNSDSRDAGKNFIRSGLWKKSRHPNYACEILMWWSVAFACFFAEGAKFSNLWYFCGALVNNLMFVFISIPMADKRQSRKPGFEEYKKETRML